MAPQGVWYDSPTVSSSSYCDAIHDGLVVVKARGFARLAPGVQILVRAEDPGDVNAMEIRTLKSAIQWRFPDANDAFNYRVGQWLCDESMFGDEVCDCNCGRFDPDCAGASGSVWLYAQALQTGELAARINCPEGDDQRIRIDGAGKQTEV